MDVWVHKPHANSVAAYAACLTPRHNATIAGDNSVKPSQGSCLAKTPVWA
jgi:hypothetical protein